MIKHKLENLTELHNPLKGKLPEVAEYFIKFYGEQYREKIIKVFNDVEFVFVDPVNQDGDTSFQVYFDSIRDRIFVQLNLELSTRGIKILNQDEFLKNIKGAERLAKTIKPEDCEQVVNLLCAFDIRHLPENLQLLADKSVTPHDFEMLLKEKDIKSDLLKFFSSVNEVYNTSKIKGSLEQLDADQKRLGFDKKVDYKKEIEKLDEKLLRLLTDTITNQFNIPKTKNNYFKIYEILPNYLTFMNGKEGEFRDMFETLFELSRNKLQLKELRAELDGPNTDFSSPYFQSFRAQFSECMEKLQSMAVERDYKILETFDDTKKVIKFLRENNMEFADQVIEMINQYKFGLLDKNAYVDSSGACVYTIKKDMPHQSKSIIVLPSYLLLKDRTLFHELNHAIQTLTISDDENSVTMKVGVPSAKLTFSKEGICDAERTFSEEATMFNEVLNDYLTEKIFEPAREMLRIGDEVENENAYYIHAFDFLSKFFEKNLDVLKECAISDDPYSFLKQFDKKDLIKLMNLTDDLMRDIKQNTLDFKEFKMQKLLLDFKHKRKLSPSELKKEYFTDGCRKFVDYLKEFDILAEEIKPLSQQTAEDKKSTQSTEEVKENYYDENGRDE